MRKGGDPDLFCDDCHAGCETLCERFVDALYGEPSPQPEHVAALILDHVAIPSDVDSEAA